MNDITKVGETLNANETNNGSDNFELIKITERNGKNVVSAKELYDFLGYDRSQWSRWYQTNILNNEYAEANVDYEAFDTVSNGNHTKEFAITIDFAKELSMLSRTEKGKKARLYFIKCEKKLMNKFPIPQTYSEALLLASNQAKQIEEQQKLIEVKDIQIVEMKPKATYYDKVLSSKDSILISVISKDYGLSAVKLNTMLHDYGVQYKRGGTWLPKSKYASSGYTNTTTSHFYKKDGSVGTRVQTEWTQTGRLFIYDLLKSKGTLPLMEI